MLSGCGGDSGQETSDRAGYESGDRSGGSSKEQQVALSPQVLELRERARVAFEERRFADSVDLCRQALQKDDRDKVSRALLVRGLLESGDYEAALDAGESLPDGPPRDALQGRASFELGRYPEAITMLERAWRRGARGDGLLYLMGQAQLRDGRYIGAAHNLRELAAREQPYEESQLHLATALGRMGERAEADSVRAAYRKTQSWREAMALRGEGLRKSQAGELELSLDYLSRALELAPDDKELPNDIGAILARLERFDEAETQFLMAAERDPENATVFRNLANLYHLMGDLEKRDEAAARYQEIAREEDDS